jgi:acyl carrier protein
MLRFANVNGSSVGEPKSTPEQPAADVHGDQSLRELIGGIWCDVLSVSQMHETDDFFALGGDSQKATRLIVALRNTVAPRLPIRAIFDHPELRAFITAVENSRSYSEGASDPAAG